MKGKAALHIGYFLFGGWDDDPGGGAFDFLGMYPDVDSAQDAALREWSRPMIWAHIATLRNGEMHIYARLTDGAWLIEPDYLSI